MFRKNTFLFFFFVAGLFVHAQEIVSGTVIDSETKKPLEGAAVYFDKSSVWTATDSQGHFELEIQKRIFTPLIINFLGYEQVVLNKPFSKRDWKIQMVKNRNELNPVYIAKEKQKRKTEKSKDHDSELKYSEMKYIALFKYYFIGKGDASNRTEILNKKVLRISSEKTGKDSMAITISALKPLKIINKHLKYNITYTLDTARILMKKNPEFGIWIPQTFQCAGSYFFKDLLDPEKRNNRFHKRREKAYEGSVLHFMRALSKENLNEEGFSVYRQDKKEKLPQHLKSDKLHGDHKIISETVNFTITPHENYTEVMPPANFFVIYNEDMLTRIDAKQNFGIDEYGNYFPWYALKFTGYMGFIGVSSAVPLDYVPKGN